MIISNKFGVFFAYFVTVVGTYIINGEFYCTYDEFTVLIEIAR